MVTIKVSKDSELSQRIQAALESGVPLYVDNGEQVVRLNPSAAVVDDTDDIWANYDPQRALDAFEQAAGILDGVDVEQLLADLREQREQDSSGRPR